MRPHVTEQCESRQIDEVKVYLLTSGSISVCDLREHVLQTVSELVEECLHLSEGHQRRLVPHWRGAVADQIRHRLSVKDLTAAQTDVHPGAAALLSWT
jgi:hypothetical protein